MNFEQIGVINDTVINQLNLVISPTPIFIGKSNIDHMIKEHPEDFNKYGCYLKEIISSPDYVSLHPNNGSIQYIKVFFDEDNEKRVLVAVRATKKGVFFARSLFVMSDLKVKNYTNKGMLKKYVAPKQKTTTE
ncbi:PBECR2 nuclease fold domain-containing protein [Bacillus sp. JHAA]|uniref:PBECR3 domain-containing polyvalent protein n=1 Tax=Bacillus sp. JHAA TaxID=3109351 RepID=UPI002FFE9369